MDVEKYKLTEAEERLIDKYLNFYRDLATGKREANTEEQKHFVKVCHGLARAETEHELAYAKYMRLQAIKYETDERVDSGIPKYEEGYPRPGWSNENDWKKMKKGDYAEMKKRSRED
jgi:uncharacterized protein YifE (UPF0438 family)